MDVYCVLGQISPTDEPVHGVSVMTLCVTFLECEQAWTACVAFIQCAASDGHIVGSSVLWMSATVPRSVETAHSVLTRPAPMSHQPPR